MIEDANEMTDSSNEIDTLRNEVLRKIGRNVVLFQKLEALMKGVAAFRNLSGSVTTLWQTFEENFAGVANQTMGQLINTFKDGLYAAEQAELDSAEERSEVWISFSFHIEGDAAFVESRNRALADVVANRNALIHKLLPKWNSDSFESCRLLEQHLDEQCIPVRAEIAHFQKLLETIRDLGKTSQEYFDSEAGQNAVDLALLQQSRIVLMIADVARQKARPDGWTYLSIAGQILKQHAPDEYFAIKSRYHRKSLLDLILAAKVFNVREERTPNGNIRILYRIDPDWTLQSAS